MFAINVEQRTIEDENEQPLVIDVVRVTYKTNGLALFKTTKKESVADLIPKAREYIRSHGYLAEWTRQVNLGNKVDWSDDMRVEVQSTADSYDRPLMLARAAAERAANRQLVPFSKEQVAEFFNKA